MPRLICADKRSALCVTLSPLRLSVVSKPRAVLAWPQSGQMFIARSPKRYSAPQERDVPGKHWAPMEPREYKHSVPLGPEHILLANTLLPHYPTLLPNYPRMKILVGSVSAVLRSRPPRCIVPESSRPPESGKAARSHNLGSLLVSEN
jgi:hypothetical protein